MHFDRRSAPVRKERTAMKYAFDNANLIDGTQDMRVQPGLCVLTDGETITDIVPAGTAPAGYTRIDLHGRYLLPGLINMHVHLAGNGKIQKKQRDLETLVRRILSNPVSRAVAYRMVCSFARTELLGGVTTIRTVGGLDTFDTRLRDEIRAGRRIGPRVLAANEAISVPGGHMAGSVAIAARTVDEALAQGDAVHAQGVDLVKLMFTGGVMDAALRSAYYLVTGKNPDPDTFEQGRGSKPWKEAAFEIPGAGKVRVAVVSGLANTRRLMEAVDSGEVDYDFVEVMACPGGCAGGGGQPIHEGVEMAASRGSQLWKLDSKADIRFSHENPDIQELYRTYLKKPLGEKAHHLLHTDYQI